MRDVKLRLDIQQGKHKRQYGLLEPSVVWMKEKMPDIQ
jgi:hypothetical protein